MHLTGADIGSHAQAKNIELYLAAVTVTSQHAADKEHVLRPTVSSLRVRIRAAACCKALSSQPA